MGIYNKALIADTLAHTSFEIDEGPYVLAGVPLDAYRTVLELITKISDDSYVELIRDDAEVSVVVTQQAWDEYFKPQFSEAGLLAPLAKVFCRVPPEYPTCTGYLLAVLDKLSPNNIGVYVQGAYTTDHIFIDAENVERVRALLSELQTEVQEIASTQAGSQE